MARCLIGLGSNLGDSVQTLRLAWERLAETPSIRAVALSGFYRTEPVGGPPQPNYLNAAGIIETDLSPERLLETLLGVEQAFGRVRTVRWGPRTLDLDLLLYDDRVIQTEKLIVPHRRMAERRFVLEPAVEIAADWLHPVEKIPLMAILRNWESSQK